MQAGKVLWLYGQLLVQSHIAIYNVSNLNYRKEDMFFFIIIYSYIIICAYEYLPKNVLESIIEK